MTSRILLLFLRKGKVKRKRLVDIQRIKKANAFVYKTDNNGIMLVRRPDA